ncbi:MOSC domain-containing protein [Oceanobacillus halophilus]|uniref:MOSC domain-containing protein n=1 Tax=Oceanobacillus halophilus TaxID=930130 RepID=A0A495A5D6_9BACI|nr:MOSC domain-containing protein [Oceanobacillus halophilus]RKQ34600.1 MOSC domain-containing protein [Oceanobacillus halophilus]
MEEPYVHIIFKGEGDRASREKFWLEKVGFSQKNNEDHAIFAYPIKHYTYWQQEEVDFKEEGSLGENFSVLEMDEFTVCIGDTFRMGDAVIQVSRPGKANTSLLRKSLRTGWYFRVVEEGLVKEGTDLELLERPYPHWSVAVCNEIMYVNKYDLRMADELSDCELLASNWRRALRKRVRGF